MFGTLLNCAAIVLGCVLGRIAKQELPPQRQVLLRILVGVAAVWFGLSIAIKAMTAADWRYAGKLFLVLVLSMIGGRLVGRLLHIQAALNRAGKYAKEKISTGNANDGLLAATILFCATPLGVVGAIEDGLAEQFRPLLLKGLIEGLGAFSFARMFGWRVALSALPVAGLQVAIAAGARALEPWLHQHNLLDPVHVACGFLVVYVALIVFEVKKVELGDYLPAIALSPAIAYVFR